MVDLLAPKTFSNSVAKISINLLGAMDKSASGKRENIETISLPRGRLGKPFFFLVTEERACLTLSEN